MTSVAGHAGGGRPTHTRELFLDLLKGSLTHTLYAGPDAVGYPPRGPVRRGGSSATCGAGGSSRSGCSPTGSAGGPRGGTGQLFAQTMVGLERLDNLRSCIETVLDEGVSGDLIETGVWRGGASIYMRGVLKAHGVSRSHGVGR